jgi:large subunit ribosomal protein L5
MTSEAVTQGQEPNVPETKAQESKVQESKGHESKVQGIPESKQEQPQLDSPPQLDTHPLKKIRIAKLTLNVGVGKNEAQLKKALVLLKKLSPVKPIPTITNKRIPGWGLRPGLQIGCKVTIRKDAEQLLKRLLVAKDNTLLEKNFDTNGNFSFGVPEYIDIEGLEYDPDLKIMGLEVAVTLERPGFRLKRRRIKQGRVGKSHLIQKENAIAFAESLGVEVVTKHDHERS